MPAASGLMLTAGGSSRRLTQAAEELRPGDHGDTAQLASRHYDHLDPNGIVTMSDGTV